MKCIESDKRGAKSENVYLWNIPRDTTYTILLNKIVCFEACNFLREIVSHIESRNRTLLDKVQSMICDLELKSFWDYAFEIILSVKLSFK